MSFGEALLVDEVLDEARQLVDGGFAGRQRRPIQFRLLQLDLFPGLRLHGVADDSALRAHLHRCRRHSLASLVDGLSTTKIKRLSDCSVDFVCQLKVNLRFFIYKNSIEIATHCQSMISFLLFPRNSVGRKNKSRAYLAHVNARVFGNDRADVERDEAEVVCGLEARAHLELDAVDVPLNSQ